MKPKIFKKSGFTIVEMLIVISIIGVLAAIILANITGPKNAARNARRAEEIRSIQQALTLYHSNHGAYPGVAGTPENIVAGSSLADLVTEGFMQSLAQDPLGAATPYRYCPIGASGAPQDYVLQATMELEEGNLPPRYNGGVPTGPYPACDCTYDAANRHYCIDAF